LTVIDEQHFLTKSDLSDRGWNSSAIEALLSTDRYVRHRRDDPMKALGVRFTALYLLKRVLKVEQSPTYAKWQSLAGQEEKDRFLEEVFSKRLARVLKYLDTDTPALQGKSQEQIDYANRVRTKELFHIASGTILLKAAGLQPEVVLFAARNVIRIDPGSDGTRWLMHYTRMRKGCCPAEYWAECLNSCLRKPSATDGGGHYKDWNPSSAWAIECA